LFNAFSRLKPSLGTCSSRRAFEDCERWLLDFEWASAISPFHESSARKRMAEKSKVSSHTVQAEDDIIAQKICEHDLQCRIGFQIAKLGPLGINPSNVDVLMHGWIFPTRGTKYPIPQLGICSINILVGPCARSSVMGR
jgi:hypothetical protein